MLPHHKPDRCLLLRQRRTFHRLQKLFPLSALRRHSLLLGQTGAGKSELLKCLLLRLSLDQRHFWQRPSITKRRSVVLIDPHGDLARECAQLRAFAPQTLHGHPISPITYLSPELAAGRRLTLNPFDLCGRKPLKQEAEVLAQQLTTVFLSMLSQGEVQLSFQMKTVLVPILTTLFLRNGRSETPPTFRDVERFLDHSRNHDLLEFAFNAATASHQRFFREVFPEKRLKPTKFALQMRLLNLLNHSGFCRLLAEPESTFDLRQLIESGNTILIDTGRCQLGHEVANIFGRTVVALIQSYAFLRQKCRKMPTYLLLDEAPSFMSEDLKTGLAEARKFGLHYLLVQQHLEQGGYSPEFRKALLGNTAFKIIGRAGHTTQSALAKEASLECGEFTGLRTGQFLVVPDSRPPFRLSAPRCYRHPRATISRATWQLHKRLLLQAVTQEDGQDEDMLEILPAEMPLFWQS